MTLIPFVILSGAPQALSRRIPRGDSRNANS